MCFFCATSLYFIKNADVTLETKLGQESLEDKSYCDDFSASPATNLTHEETDRSAEGGRTI